MFQLSVMTGQIKRNSFGNAAPSCFVARSASPFGVVISTCVLIRRRQSMRSFIVFATIWAIHLSGYFPVKAVRMKLLHFWCNIYSRYSVR